jgi:glycosyltransferase involved in cell wall biosynthesis
MSDSNPQPLVTVIIPAYNSEEWLAATLRSALGQTYPNIEVIVVNDGSTDATPEIAQAFVEADARVQLVHQSNRGLSATRNHGIRLAQGQYFAPLDADDLWHPTKIEQQVRCAMDAAARGESVGMVYCWSEIVDELGRIIRKGVPRRAVQGEVFEPLLLDNFLGNGSTPLVDTDLARKVGGYQEWDAKGCEDWTFYLMIAHEASVFAVEDYLVGYRQLASSMSRHPENMLQAHHMMLDVLRAHYTDLNPGAMRDSHTAMQLWMWYRSPVFSSEFWRMLGRLLRHDPIFWLRAPTLHKIYWMLHVRWYRFRRRSQGEDLNGTAFETA